MPFRKKNPLNSFFMKDAIGNRCELEKSNIE